MKPSLQSLLVVLLVTMFLVMSFSIRPVRSVDGNWWNANWMYRRANSITENSGYSLTDYPVEVVFEHDGHVQADGRDIRIIDNDVELPYCITGLNSTWAMMVFEINLTALSTKVIYFYYGNHDATQPVYPLVALNITEGNTGHATIDNRIYLGWDFTSWGWSSNVELWDDFRIDFNGNGNPTDDSDLIRDYGGRQGGIGRHRMDLQVVGLGDYQGYVQTSIYVDIDFADAKLRVYRDNSWVETTQADVLWIFSPSWDYADHGLGSEQNIVDGSNVNHITPSPPWQYPWNEIYISPVDFQWAAFKDSSTGEVLGSVGLNIGIGYNYCLAVKEGSDWDRDITYEFTTPYPLQQPYDQPNDCRIYWYADNSNGYSEINRTAMILHNPPIASVLSEEPSENHDIAITNIVPSQTVVGQGASSGINVTVANQGDYTETFNVKLYAKNTSEPVISQNGLVGYWKLDEGNGTIAYDSSPHTNHGILVNGPLYVDGKYGKALNLDGVDDRVDVPVLYMSSPSALTVSAWINSPLTKIGYVLYHGDNGEFCLHNGLRPDEFTNGEGHPAIAGFTVKLSNALIYTVNSPSMAPSVWHNIVGVWIKGVTLKIYVDGQLVGENTAIPDDSLFDPSSSYLPSIGVYNRANNAQDTFFNGIIDNIMVYDRVLSPEEISSQYQASILVQNQIVTLPSGNSTTITLTWSTLGFGLGNYTIEAYAEPVVGEIDTADNTMTYSPVEIVEIIPEFPSVIMAFLGLAFVTAIIILTKKRLGDTGLRKSNQQR